MYLIMQGSANTSVSELVRDLGWTDVRARSILVSNFIFFPIYTSSKIIPCTGSPGSRGDGMGGRSRQIRETLLVSWSL